MSAYEKIAVIVIIVVAVVIWHKLGRKVTLVSPTPKSDSAVIAAISRNLYRLDSTVSFNIIPNLKETYLLNKKDLHICTHNQKGQQVDFNSLMYIAIHELAHAQFKNDTSHHPPEFNTAFKRLLNKAERLGIWRRTNVEVPTNYCSI